MASKFLRYIDLREVCAFLPDFVGSFELSSEIPSIPTQLANTVMWAFWGFTGHPAFEIPEAERANISPEEMANMLDCALTFAWEERPTERTRYKKNRHPNKFTARPPKDGRIYSELMGNLCPDGPTLDALLIYQFDSLCGAYQRRNFNLALLIFSDMLDIQLHIADRDGRNFLRGMLDRMSSREASKRASKRHAQTNKQKATLIAEWDATASSYNSRADFARIVSQREGLKYRTLYDWIAEHERSKV